MKSLEERTKEIIDNFGAIQNGTPLSYSHTSDLLFWIKQALLAIRNETLEEAARIAEEQSQRKFVTTNSLAFVIAGLIRSKIDNVIS